MTADPMWPEAPVMKTRITNSQYRLDVTWCHHLGTLTTPGDINYAQLAMSRWKPDAEGRLTKAAITQVTLAPTQHPPGDRRLTRTSLAQTGYQGRRSLVLHLGHAHT